jgi:hypothetical protein
MQRFSSALCVAAVAAAALAAPVPAGAAPLHPQHSVTAGSASDGGIQTVGGRHWRHDRGPHFSFGFGAPVVPYAYVPRARVYERPYVYERRYSYDNRCPDGSYYRYPVGCVAAYYERDYDYDHVYRYGEPYPYHRGRSGVTVQFGF